MFDPIIGYYYEYADWKCWRFSLIIQVHPAFGSLNMIKRNIAINLIYLLVSPTEYFEDPKYMTILKDKIKVLTLLVAIVSIDIPLSAYATSGACSYHNGVDCDRGRQPDGSVYCNDGWTDSATYYYFTAKCQEQSGASEIEDIIWKQLRYDGKIVDGPIQFNFNGRFVLGECPLNSSRDYDHMNGVYYCICNDGYYDYNSSNLAAPNQICEKRGEPFVNISILAQKAADKIADGANRTSLQCQSRYINSFLNEKGDCACKTGYRWVYDAYEKVVFCIKRDDYEAVIKNSIPNPLENVEDVKKAEEVDYTAHGDVPEDEKPKADDTNRIALENLFKKSKEEKKEVSPPNETDKKPYIPSGIENNQDVYYVPDTDSNTETGGAVAIGIIALGATGYLYHKMKKK